MSILLGWVMMLILGLSAAKFSQLARMRRNKAPEWTRSGWGESFVVMGFIFSVGGFGIAMMMAVGGIKLF